jgi:hypothetical protein
MSLHVSVCRIAVSKPIHLHLPSSSFLKRLFSGVALRTVDIFNIVTRAWSTAQLSVSRFSLAAASVGNLAIFAGGSQTSGGLLMCSESVFFTLFLRLCWNYLSVFMYAMPWFNLSLAALQLRLSLSTFTTMRKGHGLQLSLAPLDCNLQPPLLEKRQSSPGARFFLVCCCDCIHQVSLLLQSMHTRPTFPANRFSPLFDASCFSQRLTPMPSTCTTARPGRGLRPPSALPVRILQQRRRETLHSSRVVDSSVMVCCPSGEKQTSVLRVCGIAQRFFALTLPFISGISSTVDVYNAATKTWSTAQLSMPRSSLSSASVGGVVVFAGGYNATSRTAAADIYSSTVSSSAPASTAFQTSAPPPSAPFSSSSPPFLTTAPSSDSLSSGSPSALPPSAVAGISIGIILAVIATVCLYVFRGRMRRACRGCCGCCWCCLAADKEELQLKQKLHAVGDV